ESVSEFPRSAIGIQLGEQSGGRQSWGQRSGRPQLPVEPSELRPGPIIPWGAFGGKLPPATSLKPPADRLSGPGELRRMGEAVGREDLDRVPVEYSLELASSLAESLGLLGMAAAKQQLRQLFHRREGPRVPLNQLFEGASVPIRVAGAAREPGAEGEHLGRG